MRIVQYCVEDIIFVRLNGTALAIADAEIGSERALTIATKMPGTTPDAGVEAPWGMACHFFTWVLPVGLLREEWNTLELEAVRTLCLILAPAPQSSITHSMGGITGPPHLQFHPNVLPGSIRGHGWVRAVSERC